ncbi:hypothetical protein [Xanthomonas arboricola]|uniref:hypothetical protein n=1 Tax=Xanthomonas arboricola TaxID=56448 RepID=UPI00118553E2|nr:hypothetical protein [Xanthomonas arboricola]
MKKIMKPAIVALALFSGTDVMARDALNPVSGSREVDQRILDQDVALIRSYEDLQKYVRLLPQDSPLRLLSSGASKRFISSLTFSPNGLSSYSYDDLVHELTAYEAYKVLALFGQQTSVAVIPGLSQPDEISKAAVSSAKSISSPKYDGTDYRDMKCEAPATCSPATGRICLGTNC